MAIAPTSPPSGMHLVLEILIWTALVCGLVAVMVVFMIT